MVSSLIIGLLVSGAPAAAGGSKELPVKAVYVRTGADGHVSGGVAPVTLRLTPNATGQLSIGVLEEYAGGAGAQWRTALWQAVFTATRATHTNMFEHEFILRTGGHIDGPSAGLLIAATTCALLRGKPVLPNTTMTGAVNPDGSSGPVGGIVQKMKGAAQVGVKRFGFPAGQRESKDLETGVYVDLLELGRTLGLEVKELKSLDEAYAFLTGDALPHGPAGDETVMEFSPEEERALKVQLMQESTVNHQLMAELERMTNDVQSPWLQGHLQSARYLGKLVNEAVAQGDVSWAFAKLTAANYVARSALTAESTFHRWQSLNMAQLASEVRAADRVTTELNLFVAQLDEQLPEGSRVNDAFALDVLEDIADARAALLRVETTRRQVLKVLESSQRWPDPEGMKELRAAEGKVCDAIAEAQANLEHGKSYWSVYLALRAPERARKAPGLSMERLGRAYTSNAGATRAYFEALIIAPEAAQVGMSQGQADAALAKADSDYARVAAWGVLLEADGMTSRERLAIAFQTTTASAGLVNEYYSLEASRGQNDVIVLHNKQALSNQLEFARQGVFEACNRAQQALGWVPTPAKLNFRAAMAEREGTDAQKVTALANLWKASSECHMATTRP